MSWNNQKVVKTCIKSWIANFFSLFTQFPLLSLLMWLYFILRNGWLIFHGVTPHFLLSPRYLWDDWIAFPGSIRAFSWDQNCFFSLSMRKDGGNVGFGSCRKFWDSKFKSIPCQLGVYLRSSHAMQDLIFLNSNSKLLFL
jgi:hypothetical protein